MPEMYKGYELPIKVFRQNDEWCALLGENFRYGISVFAKDPVTALAKLYGALHPEEKDKLIDIASNIKDTLLGN